MVNNFKILLVLVGIAGAVTPAYYFSAKYNQGRSLNIQLSQVLDETVQENDSLQKSLSEIEKKVLEQEMRLRDLSDVERLKNSFQNSQQFVSDLNKKIAEIEKDRQALQTKNTGLSTRLENTNKELARSLEELRGLRTEVARLDSGQTGALKRKIDELSRDNDLKSGDLRKIREDLAKMQAANEALAKQNADLESAITDLQKGKGLDGQKLPLFGQMQNNIDQLKATVGEKEAKIQQLESELNSLNSMPGRLSQKANKEQLGQIETLESVNKELKRKVALFEKDLDEARSDLERLRKSKGSPDLTAQYENARSQISKLSELLVRKESEIESARKESFDLREKMIALQAKLSNLESDFSAAKLNTDKVKDLENKKIDLDSRISVLQETVAKKNELVSSLQSNLEYLTTKLAKKENELASLESKYSDSDSQIKEEAEKQKSRYDEINLLYNSLKTQVSQFSDALNQKEGELEQRRREIGLLKEEVAGLKSRSENLENDLSEAKDRQRRTLEDLLAAQRLNTAFQERLMGITPASEPAKPAASEQQKKADELKRKIEVILNP